MIFAIGMIQYADDPYYWKINNMPMALAIGVIQYDDDPCYRGEYNMSMTLAIGKKNNMTIALQLGII